MNIVISGIAAAVVLGVVSAYALRVGQEPAGYNLVGKNWSGEPKLQRKSS